MKDRHNEFVERVSLAPAVRTADVSGAWIDRAGFESVEHVLSAGVGGITFDVDNRIDVIMEDSDDAITATAVASTEVLGGPTDMADGKVKVFAAAHAAAAVYAYGYRGGKRYSRLRLDFVGTHGTGTPTAATARLGDAHASPTPAAVVLG